MTVHSHRSTISSAKTNSLRPGGVVDRKPSISTTRRSAISSQGGSKKTGAMSPQLENSYKLAPEARFDVKRVETLLQQILESRLEKMQYSEDAIKSLTTELSETIKVRVKTLGFSRHKLVCNVIIGPVGGQCVRVASRCVWDDRYDDYASTTYTNSSLFAVALVYGIYFE